MLPSVSKMTIGVILFTVLTAECKYVKPWRARSDCTVSKGALLIQRDGCQFKIQTFGCRGACLSSAKPFSHRSGFASSCSCCAPIQDAIEEKTVECRGVRKVIRYPVAKKCACRPCLNVT